MGTGVTPKRIATEKFVLPLEQLNSNAIPYFILLFRKEVIQPQVLLRLPCYDFTPVIRPAFDGSFTRLGHRLRAFPTPMV